MSLEYTSEECVSDGWGYFHHWDKMSPHPPNNSIEHPAQHCCLTWRPSCNVCLNSSAFKGKDVSIYKLCLSVCLYQLWEWRYPEDREQGCLENRVWTESITQAEFVSSFQFRRIKKTNLPLQSAHWRPHS